MISVLTGRHLTISRSLSKVVFNLSDRFTGFPHCGHRILMARGFDTSETSDAKYLRGVHGHASKYIVSFNSQAGRPNPTLNSTSKQYVTTAKLHNARTFSKPFIGKRSNPNKSFTCPSCSQDSTLRAVRAETARHSSCVTRTPPEHLVLQIVPLEPTAFSECSSQP
jgi:hypothetical protein